MKVWKPLLLRTAAAFALCAGIGAVASTHALAEEMRAINVQQGNAMKEQGAILLDVRETHEYEEVRVPGSVHVPLGQLPSRLQEIRQLGSRPVAVICRSGRRSAIAAEQLQQAGWTNVYNVEGGMLAWERAELPVERARK